MFTDTGSFSRNEEKAIDWDADAGRRETAQFIGQTIIRKIPLQKDWIVLDFGAGTGLISKVLSPRVKTIWAVDSSPGMLAELRRKQISNVKERVLDWEKDPFPDRKFQLVIMSMTLHHIKNHSELLKKLYEVLQPGGWLCLADLYSEPGIFHSDKNSVAHFGFDPNRLRADLTEIGFKPVSYFHVYTIISKKIASGDCTFPLFFMYGRKEI